MKQELGKWLMDIAKYITTAVLLTSVFNYIESDSIMLVFAVIASFITLAFGLFLMNDKNNK